MDIHIIVKLKSSYEDWHKLFLEDTDNRAKICNENRTLVGKANEKTAVITLFDVDEAAMKEMMEDPDFQKMVEPYVEEHIPFALTPISPE
tara:strand:- start:206 stop:475 length:270 start_codon:yes stop_codon:yes gene_type:complete